MTVRDWRSGELTMLLLALVLAVAALTSVGFVADRLRLGLDRDARKMIGADLVIRADQPIEDRFAAQARGDGLRIATTAIFPSMVSAAQGADTSRLAALKAVSPGYPLRGEVRIATRPNGPDAAAASIPESGTVWVDPTLLDALHLHVGDSIKLGVRDFRVAAVITRELDRGFSFVNFSPRVMLNASDLGSTRLVGYGSRVVYRLLVAGADPAVAQFRDWAHAQVDGGKMRGVAIETIEEGQPQVRDTLTRARHFLTLVALLTALLAAVAIAMGAHRYMRRHLDGCAVMRCLGASRADLRAGFIIEFLLVGLGGSVLGVLVGYGGHAVLLSWLGQLIDVVLPQPTFRPVLEGLAAGLVLLLGFAVPPLLPLTQVPPARVLRRELGEAARVAWFAYAVGVALFAGLLILAAGEVKLGGIVAGGFAGGLVVFGGVSRGVLFALARTTRQARHARAFAGLGWRYALASLERRGLASALQITALGIGLMCLLLLAMTRNDLIDGWRKSTPPDAPNQFVIDIQPNQRDGVLALMKSRGFDDVQLAPMVRGRLIAIDGRKIDPDAYKDEETRRLVDREFNLSYSTALAPDNRVVSGTWFGADPKPQISLEQGMAKRLKVKVGDVLRFDVAGQAFDAPVTSIRMLDWGTFRVNFFAVLPPAAMTDFPATFITAFRLPPGDAGQATIDALIHAYPNLTVIDTGQIIAQMQRILNQVIGAVQFLFVFTLAAGVLVLYAALAGTRDERTREAALLRALGASQQQIRSVQVTEFVVVGGLAGLLAALGAQVIGWVLADRVFQFRLELSVWLPFAGLVAGIACATVGGWFGLRRVLRRPALQSLRDA
ncbi:ABC transporter permease [Pararobbsia silviterrae]|uniref:FtsX-like permease family protein n=1 Tax=Pararobbsia silviterrae TaxID=1792498 RepID=A0A494YBV1_9BURK|nr:FtsX-like permease family protein [Pararobbsia silviterrae]RKP57434.1 FtsX-like permease family protein [Pararobbsia silviterrae]